MPTRALSFVLLVEAIVAQAPSLPKLLHLGPLPDAPVHTLTNVPFAPSAGGRDLVLHVERDVTAQRLEAALRTLRAAGVTTVHFAASLPDGRRGALALALPDGDDAATNLTLRSHHERAGVPAASATPLLQRLGDGWRQLGGRPFVLRLEVPAGTPWHRLLPLLAAVAEGAVDSVVLCTTPAVPRAEDGALALDLVGILEGQVVATAPPADKPRLEPTRFGCLQPAPTLAPPPRAEGAGGRFGARGSAAGVPADTTWWLPRQQQPDGSLLDDRGTPDPEAMALWCLSLLADGTTLGTGQKAAELRRCLGWIVAHQQDDGRFEDFAPGSVRRHAQLTYALVEAAGLSADGDLLRQATADAIAWLLARREQDGGWTDIPGTRSDPVVTAWALTALASAEFFRFEVPKPAALVAWFDEHPQDAGPAAAAELFCRCFAGQSPRANQRLATLADRLLADADPGDPHTAFWVTHALFQAGGKVWAQWSKRVTTSIAAKQETEGDRRGSWAPAGGASRLTTTLLNSLTLQAYYRYSRLVR